MTFDYVSYIYDLAQIPLIVSKENSKLILDNFSFVQYNKLINLTVFYILNTNIYYSNSYITNLIFNNSKLFDIIDSNLTINNLFLK